MEQLKQLISDLTNKLAQAKNESIELHKNGEQYKCAIKEGECIAFKLCISRLKLIINNSPCQHL